jgi:hypothetical protein
MLPRYVQCDYPQGDDGKCGATSKRIPGSALNHCPRHRARLPYWPTDAAEPTPPTPTNDAEGGPAP